MMHVLEQALIDLPHLLHQPEKWQSLWINYHKPYVERLWIAYGENRLYVHRILPCTKEDALVHKHKWPMATYIADGGYCEDWHYICDDTKTLLGHHVREQGARYEMCNSDLAHVIYPEYTSLSVMVTGTPWDEKATHHGAHLELLSDQRKDQLMRDIIYAIKKPSRDHS